MFYPGQCGLRPLPFNDRTVLEWCHAEPHSRNYFKPDPLVEKWDVWVCYDLGYILCFPDFPDEAKSHAMGQRLLKPSKFYYRGQQGPGGTIRKEWLTKEVVKNTLLWHHHDVRER